MSNKQIVEIMTMLSNTKKGDLVKLNRNSDVYEVLEVGFNIRVQNKYTDKISSLKPYTMKGGKMHPRKIEIVQFY